MNCLLRSNLFVAAFTLALGAMGQETSLSAQSKSNPAPAKPDPVRRGDQYQLAAGKTSNMHAHDHARLLGKYAAAAEHPVPSDVLAHHADAIQKNVEAARKSFSQIRTTGTSDGELKKQLADIQARLAKVSASVDQLKSDSKVQGVEAKTVLAKTDAISQELKQVHESSKRVDQIYGAALQTGGDFSDRDSDSYYFTGEGHFID